MYKFHHFIFQEVSDLTFVFSLSRVLGINCFAVGCKQRRKFYAGKITWANKEQLCLYEDFEDRTRIPVFIAIGIGGEPSNPAKLFVTTLQQIINNIEVYEFELIPFQWKPTLRFFYDTVQLKLF